METMLVSMTNGDASADISYNYELLPPSKLKSTDLAELARTMESLKSGVCGVMAACGKGT